MPVRMLNFVTTPPPRYRGNRGGSMVTKTDEWHDLCLALGAGLKPHEYISVTYTNTHDIYKDLKEPNLTLLTYAKKKIKELQLPYDAYIRDQVVYIVGRGSIA